MPEPEQSTFLEKAKQILNPTTKEGIFAESVAKNIIKDFTIDKHIDIINSIKNHLSISYNNNLKEINK